MQKQRTDYHVHPNYSPDAAPIKIKEYCLRALEIELVEICFTTHLEFPPECSIYDHESWLDSYFYEIAQAQQEFKNSGLKIKAGVEVGYQRAFEKETEAIINRYPFDYVLGAVHSLNGISIASKKESPHYFGSRSLTAVRRDYFDALEGMVKSGLFDCAAHLDIYRRYGAEHYGPQIAAIHQGIIEPIFKEMARRNMGLEINTSSLRRGLKEFHPTRKIIAAAVQSGIKVFTVGSDAHALNELGNHIDDALKLLNEFSVYNHVFTRRQAVPLV